MKRTGVAFTSTDPSRVIDTGASERGAAECTDRYNASGRNQHEARARHVSDTGLTISQRLSAWLQRLGPSDAQILVALGLVVGLGAGLGAVAFRWLINAVGLLLVLVVAKILAVSVTIGSGGSGGVFAPSLFVGAMLGTAFGAIANLLFPGAIAPAGAYGLVGMAAVFSGAARAPITSVIILFELTSDYRIILPLMVTVVLSTLVSEALSRDTIYTLKLHRRGIDVRAGRDVDLMRALPVAQAMTTRLTIATADVSVAEAGERLDREGSRALLVLDATGALDGIATLQDVATALLDNQPGLTLGQIASRPVITVHPHESLSQALHKIGVRDVGQVPVIARGANARVLGMLHRSDVVRAYSGAILERLEDQTHRPVLGSDLRGTRVVEVASQEGGPLIDRTVAELRLPPDTLLVAIQRGSLTLIPRGDTRLQSGVCLQILVRDSAIAALHEHVATLNSGAPP